MIQNAFVVVFLLIFVATAALTIGGLASVIQIPERYDKHFLKLVYGLLGEVAVAVIAVFASFNLAGDGVSDANPERIHELISPSSSTWIPVGRDTGLPVTLTVRTTGDTIMGAATVHSFGSDLSIVADASRKGRYVVVHERLPGYHLGLLDTDDLRQADLLSRVQLQVNDVTIRRVHLDTALSDPALPFTITLYERGDALRFKLTVADTVIVDRAANKELHRVLPIEGESFLLTVVLSVPDGIVDGDGSRVSPFAEFAIGRLSATWTME